MSPIDSSFGRWYVAKGVNAMLLAMRDGLRYKRTAENSLLRKIGTKHLLNT